MANPKLDETLLKLKTALKGTEITDGQSRKSLEELVILIEKKLNASPQSSEHAQLLQALQERVVYFENSYPVVSRTLEEIIDILTKMGL